MEGSVRTLMLILSLNSAYAFSSICGAIQTAAGRTARSVVKGSAYPIVLLLRKTLHEARAFDQGIPWGWRNEGRYVLSHDLPAIFIYAGLVAANQWGPFISIDEFTDRTEEFLEGGDGEPLLVINAFDPEKDAEHFRSTRERFEREFHGRKNAHYVEITKREEFYGKLYNFVRQVGPLGKLEINAHGWGGSFAVGRDSHIDEEWLDRIGPSSGFFIAGAKVRFSSCRTGMDESGAAFARKWGAVFLKDGGTIYSSRVDLSSSDSAYFHYFVRPVVKYFVPSVKTAPDLIRFSKYPGPWEKRIERRLNPILRLEIPARN